MLSLPLLPGFLPERFKVSRQEGDCAQIFHPRKPCLPLSLLYSPSCTGTSQRIPSSREERP